MTASPIALIAPARTPVAAHPMAVAAAPRGEVAVQLSAELSQPAAEAAWHRMQQRLPSLLADRQPILQRFETDGKVYWRVRTGWVCWSPGGCGVLQRRQGARRGLLRYRVLMRAAGAGRGLASASPFCARALCACAIWAGPFGVGWSASPSVAKPSCRSAVVIFRRALFSS